MLFSCSHSKLDREPSAEKDTSFAVICLQFAYLPLLKLPVVETAKSPARGYRNEQDVALFVRVHSLAYRILTGHRAVSMVEHTAHGMPFALHSLSSLSVHFELALFLPRSPPRIVHASTLVLHFPGVENSSR